MSGGSYNYLCFADDLETLLEKSSNLQPMADRLTGLGYADDAAKETEEIHLILRQMQRQIEMRVKRLQVVWRSVEWWDSCDSGEDGVISALERYRMEVVQKPEGRKTL